MYVPYFRGKDYALDLLRVSAPLLTAASILPIVEPVKLSTKHQSLYKALVDARLPLIIVANPRKGELKNPQNAKQLRTLLGSFGANPDAIFGLLVDRSTKLVEIQKFFQRYSESNKAIIFSHTFKHHAELVALCRSQKHLRYMIFIRKNRVDEAYWNSFIGWDKVVLEDGFINDKATKNVERLPEHHFSSLPLTYRQMGLKGYGDFSIIGDRYGSGGNSKIPFPFCIHLTHFDADNESEKGVKMRNFISDTVSNTDIEGRYAESISKMRESLAANPPKIWTRGLETFKSLLNGLHFPGQPKIKEYSMLHHMDLMIEIQNRNSTA